MAEAANRFLDSLVEGEVPETKEAIPILEREMVAITGCIESEEEGKALQECNDWIIKNGLPEGELSYELTDQNTGESLAILDLAWPNGIQEGYSQPVALLINEERETHEIVNRAGYRYFTDIDAFKEYVEHEVLAAADVIA